MPTIRLLRDRHRQQHRHRRRITLPPPLYPPPLLQSVSSSERNTKHSMCHCPEILSLRTIHRATCKTRCRSVMSINIHSDESTIQPTPALAPLRSSSRAHMHAKCFTLTRFFHLIRSCHIVVSMRGSDPRHRGSNPRTTSAEYHFFGANSKQPSSWRSRAREHAISTHAPCSCMEQL